MTTTRRAAAVFVRRMKTETSLPLALKIAENGRARVDRRQAPEPGSWRKIGRYLDVRREAASLERLDQAPTQVRLAGEQPHLGGARESMVIIVPTLPHADQTGELHVV